MEQTPVVTVFLRNATDVLLLRRSEAVGSYRGRWGAVAGHAEGDSDGGDPDSGGPDAAARQEIREETGIDPTEATTLVRRGEPFAVSDPDLDTEWVVHPYLFDCETRAVTPNEETSEFEWVSPTAIRRRETVPDLWTSYDRVRPTVETVATDREHGSAYISLRALAVLRDEAAVATDERQSAHAWAHLDALARELVDARQSMPVVRNRIDRAVTAAIDANRTPQALEIAAEDGIERALTVDSEAAARTAERVRGQRIATLSRSGTVSQTLAGADPAAVLVAESRPGGEGVAVASALRERLPDDTSVTLTTDAAFAFQLADRDADVLLVGADAVLPDGRVVNKVGTRGAALAAAGGNLDVVVVAASDKVVPAAEEDGDAGGAERPGVPVPELEERGRSELTDDDRVAVANPTFDVTPPHVVDAVVTEAGVLTDPADVGAVAADHRSLASWRTA